jgi:hypothetical protein
MFTQLDMNLQIAPLEIIGRSGIGYSFDPITPGQVLEDKYAVTLKELLGVSAHHAASIFIQTD